MLFLVVSSSKASQRSVSKSKKGTGGKHQMFVERSERRLVSEKEQELGDSVPNLLVASPFESIVYSSVWSSDIVTLGKICPLSAVVGEGYMLEYGCEYQTHLSKQSFGMSTFRMCTSV